VPTERALASDTAGSSDPDTRGSFLLVLVFVGFGFFFFFIEKEIFFKPPKSKAR
jgi:hypothetical protein